MNSRSTTLSIASSLGALLLVLATSVFAEAARPGEAPFSGLHVHIEQDLFVNPFGLGRDQNYTMGVGIQATGRWFRHVGYPQHGIDQLLTWAIPSVRLTPREDCDETFHSLMIVGSAFTPDNLLATEPVKDDRPYASFPSTPLVSVAGAVQAARGEFFAFGAVRGRGVLYNALLQGGVKDSSHKLSSSDISRGILEFELGIHGLVPLDESYSLYATWAAALAGRSPEFHTDLSRWHWWGSLQLGVTYSAQNES